MHQYASQTALLLVASFVVSGCAGAPVSQQETASVFIHIHGLAVDSGDPRVLFVATHGGVIKGLNDADWRYAGPDRSDYMGFTLHPFDNKTAYSSGHPVRGGNQGIRESTDGAQTWETIALAGAVDCHAMTLSPPEPGTVYCGSSRGDFYRSLNGKDFQTSPTAGLAKPVFVLAAPFDDPTRVYAGTQQGLFTSENRGESWQLLTGAPTRPVTALAIDPKDSNVLYAYFQGGTPSLARSSDRGRAWQAVSEGIPSSAVLTVLAIDSTNPSTLYGSAATTIFKSTNAGTTWEEARSGS